MGQGISTTQFFLYGKRHFTSKGYLRHVKDYKAPVQDKPYIGMGQEGSDGVSMKDKVVVITGANSGVGKELATYAAAKGATLYMICRSKDRAEEARKEILEQTKANNEKVKVLLADVGELSQVQSMVKELQQQESQVDCLVCNAGALLDKRTETSEGNEVTFASHLLGGSYLLSQLLLPQLKAATGSRVVFVSSAGMYNYKFPDWPTATCTQPHAEKKYAGQMQYTYAKRGQVLLAEQWSKEIPEVKWVSSHPGWTNTPGVDEAFGSGKKFLEPLRQPWQGSEGIAWLMAAPAEELESGAFYLDREPQTKHLAGPFFSEGKFTKNTQGEVEEMMSNLKKAAGL